MTDIQFQVYGINLLVRLLAEAPADVRVHCPKGSPIRYGEVVGRGDGFDEGANAFREMPPIRSVVAFEENPEEVEGPLLLHRGRGAPGHPPGRRHPVVPSGVTGSRPVLPPRRAGYASLPRLLGTIDRDELVELTRALVRIPSVYRPGDPDANESRVAAFVEAWLRREQFEVEVQPVAPGRPNVIGALGEKRPGRRSLLLEGHTDVVTEGDPAAWSRPPFGGDLVDGRIYGRGAADMKGGLAAAMVAAAAFRRAGVEPAGKLVVGALVDEEDRMIGVRHLVSTAVGRELDAAIICEPEENELCLEQRGVVWARIRARGRMAHGAMPEAGVNPIFALGAMLREIRAVERRIRKRCERSSAPPAGDRDAHHRPGPARAGSACPSPT